MMKKLVVVFLVILNCAKAQDTLFYKSGEKQIVKVAEINPQLIKYRKFENLSGPVYNISKADIICIKYFGGQIDSLTVTPAVTLLVKPPKNSMTCIGGKIFYNQDQIGTDELWGIIDNVPNESAKKKMKMSYRQMIAHRDIATASLACGLVLGCAAVIATAPFVTGLVHPNSLNLPTDDGVKVAVIGILCGGAMRITGFAVSQSQRNKKKAKMREIVSIYNGDYDFK